jgi:hypothetical protein
MIPSLERALKGLPYEAMNSAGRSPSLNTIPTIGLTRLVSRRLIEETDPEPTLFTLERYAYRAWHKKQGTWRAEGKFVEIERLQTLLKTNAGFWATFEGNK